MVLTAGPADWEDGGGSLGEASASAARSPGFMQARSPEERSATNAVLRLMTAWLAEPGVSANPTTTGDEGSEASITTSPLTPAATKTRGNDSVTLQTFPGVLSGMGALPVGTR